MTLVTIMTFLGRRLPARVTAGDPEDTVEDRRVGGDADLRPEQPLGAAGPEVPDHVEHGVEAGPVVPGGLPDRPGQVPTVDHQLVQSDDAGDVPGQVDAARRGHAGPGGRVAPRLGQLGQLPWDAGAPVGPELGAVAGRSSLERTLDRRHREGERRPADVVQQVGDGVGGTRRRLVQGNVRGGLHQARHPTCRRFEINGRGHRLYDVALDRESSAER
jgi:hypothetical protein